MATRRRLVRVVAAIVAIVLALVGILALWTLYENTFSAAALGWSGSGNARPSVPGQLSPTAARALEAYGGWGGLGRGPSGAAQRTARGLPVSPQGIKNPSRGPLHHVL